MVLVFTGGNALFKFEFNDKSASGTLNILHSEFTYGRSFGSTLSHGGGLAINIKSKDSVVYSELEFYNITVYNCSMYKTLPQKEQICSFPYIFICHPTVQ